MAKTESNKIYMEITLKERLKDQLLLPVFQGCHSY